MALKQVSNPLGFWIALGTAIGTGLGVSMHNIALGVALGVSFGVAIGLISQKKARRDRDRSA